MQEKALVGAFSAIVQLHRLIVLSTEKKDKALYQFLLAMTGISLTLSESSDTTEPVLCLLTAGPGSANGSGDHWAMDQWGPGAGSRDQASCTASCTATVHGAVLTIVIMCGEPYFQLAVIIMGLCCNKSLTT